MTDTPESVRSVLPYADGRFVHYSDYLALQNRYAALLERIENAPVATVISREARKGSKCYSINVPPLGLSSMQAGQRVALVQIPEK